jgi:hypothetical protein
MVEQRVHFIRGNGDYEQRGRHAGNGPPDQPVNDANTVGLPKKDAVGLTLTARAGANSSPPFGKGLQRVHYVVYDVGVRVFLP